MTSIITFQLDFGNQRIVIGDTQHTYRASTHENSKIFPLKDKKLIFCGAGNDRVIDSINTKIVSMDVLNDCSNKIVNFKEHDLEGNFILHDLHEKDSLLRNQEIKDTHFLILDSISLKGEKITDAIPKPIGNISMIGSGAEFVGLVDTELESLYNKKFDDDGQQEILEIILNILCILGRQDSSTGHPAIFKIEGYLLEKDKSPRKIEIRYMQDLQKFDNYNCEVEE